MPTIDIAMAQSVGRRGLLDVIGVALQPVLHRRDAITTVEGHITDVKTAFSSWGNCMQAAFCKWPVIAIIIVGSLFLLSIVWCIARCACCGLSCCCECFHCLKCCGNCCGCCDPPRGKAHKYLDEPYIPPNQGYRHEEPMYAGAAARPIRPETYKPPPAAYTEAPQFADFDVSKKPAGGEDALPVMPSWENASKKKVLVEEDPLEMDDLKKPADAAGQNVPLMTGSHSSLGPASPGAVAGGVDPHNLNHPFTPPPLSVSPTNGFGIHPAMSNGYLAAGAVAPMTGSAAAPAELYNHGNQYNQNDPYAHNDPYSHSELSGESYVAGHGNAYANTGNGSDAAYTDAAVMGPGARRHSPGQFGNNGYDPNGAPPQQQQQVYHRNNQIDGGSYDDFRRNGTGGVPPQTYGMDRRSPRIPDVNGAPGYGGGGAGGPQSYGRSNPYGGNQGGQGGRQPVRMSPPNNYGRPPNSRPPPQRQYSPANHDDGGASPTNIQNNGGFDFSSGYSRPQTQGRDEYSNNSGNNSYYQQAVGQAPQQSGAYPGYRPY